MLCAVVPSLNAESRLEACLTALGGADDIILVDGGSTDRTTAIARSSGARVIDSPPGRGVQIAKGVAAATGDWLILVHADTVLAPGWKAAAERHMTAYPGRAGYFRFRLDSTRPQARLLEKLVMLRCRLFALPYGDQPLLVPRRLLDRVGGIAPLPLMEDVDLVRRIGRRRLKLIPVDAMTCARRWTNDGWLARSARNLLCLGLYRLGVPVERIARLYR